MGMFEARIGVSNGNGGSTEWVDAQVDTGATWTVLPDSLLRERLGVVPIDEVDFTLADESLLRLPTGLAWLVVEGQRLPHRVVFGPESECLLGATTLQVCGLIPDTTHHKLIPAPKFKI